MTYYPCIDCGDKDSIDYFRCADCKEKYEQKEEAMRKSRMSSTSKHTIVTTSKSLSQRERRKKEAKRRDREVSKYYQIKEKFGADELGRASCKLCKKQGRVHKPDIKTKRGMLLHLQRGHNLFLRRRKR